MIAKAQGRIYTSEGNFLFTSWHTKKSLLPWQRKSFFVGYWANRLSDPVILDLTGEYIIETFRNPIVISIDPSIDKINQMLEEAEENLKEY